MIDREDIRTLIDSHSRKFTVEHIYQEFAELIVTVSKLEIRRDEIIRHGASPHIADSLCVQETGKLYEELADVLIMVEIVREMYGIDDSRLGFEIEEKMVENLQRARSC